MVLKSACPFGISLGFASCLLIIESHSAQAALTIAESATQNVVCTASLCSATAADAVLSISDLKTLLVGSSVTVTAGTVAQDILIQAPISWKNPNALALDAHGNVQVSAAVTVRTGQGLSVITYDGAANPPAAGRLRFGKGGSITFLDLSAGLAIDGQPYTLVSSATALATGIAASPSGNFALAASYNSGKVDGQFTDPPVPTPFGGHLDGLGNTITYLGLQGTHGTSSSAGLFATVLAGGVIQNLKLENARIRGLRYSLNVGSVAAGNYGTLFGISVSGEVRDGTNTGGLVGYNAGAVTLCTSSANVKDGSNTGGLVGQLDFGGTIDQSFATGYVLGGNEGGLVGLNEGDVTNTYATGAIGTFPAETSAVAPLGSHARPTGVGGLVGYAKAPVASSYATGRVTIFGPNLGIRYGAFAGASYVPVPCSACYWDTDTSSLDYGVGGEYDFGGKNPPQIVGLSDAELTSSLPAGFDPTIWAENSGINNGRPYLIDMPP